MKTAQYVRQEKAIGFDVRPYLPGNEAVLAEEARRETRQLLAKMDIGHIYVVEFSSGVVKVGKSTNPAARIATHTLLATVHGGAVRSSWVSRAHFRCGENERDLIAYCSRIGHLVTGREYFRAPFSKVRSRASLLATNSPPLDDLASYRGLGLGEIGST